MSKKRRVFDIDLPEEAVTAPETKSALDGFPAGNVPNNETKRRGPMASAISETAGSLRDRSAVEADIRAENDALAHEYVRLKRLGLMTDLVPLDNIVTEKLVRDRSNANPDYDLGELKKSIAAVGLSNPIRVEPREDGKYELVQGYRRLAAFKELRGENPDDDTWQAIPAAIFAPGETLETLYRRMVDENLIRKDVSFGEMALLVMSYCADPDNTVSDYDTGVSVLYASASPQKRSYIRKFVKVIDILYKELRFPEEIPRDLGLALARSIEEVPGTVRAIQDALRDWEYRGVVDELDVLRKFAGGGAFEDLRTKRTRKPKAEPGEPTNARTSFQMRRPQGQVKCTAGAGRFEIRLDRDFSAIDRRKLEMAVQSFLSHLD